MKEVSDHKRARRRHQRHLFAITLIALGGLMLSGEWTVRHGHSVVLDGTVEVMIVGNRLDADALQRIAVEIKRHPDADQFVVHITNWLTWLHLDGSGMATLIYDRGSHTFDDFEFGGEGVWKNVSDKAIERVADRHGDASDLEGYGAKWDGV